MTNNNEARIESTPAYSALDRSIRRAYRTSDYRCDVRAGLTLAVQASLRASRLQVACLRRVRVFYCSDLGYPIGYGGRKAARS